MATTKRLSNHNITRTSSGTYQLSDVGQKIYDQMAHQQTYRESKYDEKIAKQRLEQLKKEAEYAALTLDAKKRMREQEVKSLETSLKKLKAEKDIADVNGATLEQLAEFNVAINDLQEKINKKKSEALKMDQELNRAYYENVSILEKKAAVQERINQAQQKEKLLRDEMIQKIAAGGDKSALTSEYNSLIKNMYSEMGLNKLGGLGFKEAISGGLSEALNSGSVASGISSIFGSMLGSKLSPILSTLNLISNITGAINNTLDKGIQDALSVQSSYLGKVNARLQGSSESFQSIQETISTTFKDSPFISQKKIIENISTLVDRGVASNVEEIGVIMTLSDRMVSTFDALDGTLLRLNRLQQADLTASQLGYEALLTNFFNQTFGDTSYLSGVYDTVASTILDATSQLDNQTAGAFNFAVQKWLGSLYAVGMSEQGISTIAQGLNYIATGNVSAFNSNEGLRNLFAGASGSAFSSILTGGLNAETVNSLMMSIVEYLREIAGDTNTVTRQARAGIFGGFSLSDIRAVGNLSASTLSSIYNTSGSYSDAINETARQLVLSTNLYDANGGTDSRFALSEVVDNMINNALFGFGASRISNASDYALWRIESMLADSGSTVLGFLGNTLKLVSNLGSFGELISSIRNIASASLDMKGAQRSFLSSALLSSISSTTPKLRGNAVDYASMAALNTITGLSLSESLSSSSNFADLAATAAATSSKTTYAGGEVTRTIADLYSELFERQTTSMKVSLTGIDSTAANILNTILQNNSDSNVRLVDISGDAIEVWKEQLGGNAVEAISEKLDGTIKVDNTDNFVYTLDYGLAQSRGL